jgi:hypothetical protein
MLAEGRAYSPPFVRRQLDLCLKWSSPGRAAYPTQARGRQLCSRHRPLCLGGQGQARARCQRPLPPRDDQDHYQKEGPANCSTMHCVCDLSLRPVRLDTVQSETVIRLNRSSACQLRTSAAPAIGHDQSSLASDSQRRRLASQSGG